MAPAATFRERREEIVREHRDSENRHDFDAMLATFDHPRYEIVATGDVYDGADEVSRYYAETRAALPDQRNRLVSLHHADDAVVVEFDLLGTHRGRFRSLPATGRRFECRMAALFLFDDDRLVCERVYFEFGDAAAPAGHSPRSAQPARARRDRPHASNDDRQGDRQVTETPLTNLASI